jgi:endonuclease-3
MRDFILNLVFWSIFMKNKLTKATCLKVVEILNEMYPDAKAELDFKNPFELLVATVLSAQCTDVRVNEVTKVLFKEAPDVVSLDQMPLETLAEIIRSCGLYKSKSKNLKETARLIIEKYDGLVPKTIDELTTLPGVGRKTANVVVSNAFGTPAIAVDTHVFRVSNRIGLVHEKNVENTEEALMKVVPRTLWTKTHHTIIFHGRRVCKARKPDCESCQLSEICLAYINQTL